MPGLASIARAALGARPIGTLNQATLTYAFMEFLLNQDSNAMKALWFQHGFTDESPIWGSRSTVPTFKNQRSVIEQWPDFQWQMQEVDADWYYLSGHHGRRLSADARGIDEVTHVNTQKDVGFFNAHYHHGTWEGHAAKELEVYMSTSTGPWDVYEHGPRDNPLHGQPHPKCEGADARRLQHAHLSFGAAYAAPVFPQRRHHGSDEH